jgi:hypothetical protein
MREQHWYIEVNRDELPTLGQSGTYRGGEAVAFQHQMAQGEGQVGQDCTQGRGEGSRGIGDSEGL